MKHKGKQAGERFWRIENEILIPFVIIGILVLIAFGAVSCYNLSLIHIFYPGAGNKAVNTYIDGFYVDANGVWRK